MSKLKAIGVLALLILAMGIVGQGDLEEAERQEDEYCYNVHSGRWPDYRGDYRVACTADGRAVGR